MSRALWDHVRFQARLRPGALALFGPAGPIAYQTLVHHVEALATELLERDVTRRDRVGIRMGFSYLHLLLILALDRLGIASMSFATADPAAPPNMLPQRGLTAIIAAGAAPAVPPCRWIAMPDEHRPKLGKPDAARLQLVESADDDLVRLIWSSGTSGGAKAVPISRVLQARRIASRRLVRGLATRTRYFTGSAFASSPGYIMPLAVLAAGGAVILPNPPTDFVSLANALGVTATSGSPAMLAELLGKSGNLPRRLETMELFMVSGAALPAQLAREARRLLTPNLWIGYGTTETDGVALADSAVGMADPSAAGFVFPWVDAQIVDAADRPLAAGQEGMLRLRSEQTIAGYHLDDEATRRNFRDGWFYPGDVGAITAHGLLRIMGRIEDAIIRDGVTSSPLPLEELIRGVPGVRDVAVFPLSGADGAQEVCAALVLDRAADPAGVVSAVRAQLGAQAPARLFALDSLPRNPNGKLLRRALADMARRSARL